MDEILAAQVEQIRMVFATEEDETLELVVMVNVSDGFEFLFGDLENCLIVSLSDCIEIETSTQTSGAKPVVERVLAVPSDFVRKVARAFGRRLAEHPTEKHVKTSFKSDTDQRLLQIRASGRVMELFVEQYNY